MDKKQARLRRASKTRAKIREQGAHRLCVYRSPQHVYAQVIAPDGSHVVAHASTLEQEIRAQIKGHFGNVNAAEVVGRVIAERAKAAGVEQVAFDRSGFRYHGRIKALADSARENGLQF